MHVIDFVFETLEPKFKGYFASDVQARQFTRMLKRTGLKNLVGVEIGVSAGNNALNLFRQLQIKHLYLIDPWEKYIDEGEIFDHTYTEKHARDILRPYTDRVTFIKKYSQNAIVDVPDDVDFVYIDGNHQEEYVYEDCVLYYGKLRDGGFMGGHDFNLRDFGVVYGVLRFVKDYDLKLFGNLEDWWVQK